MNKKQEQVAAILAEYKNKPGNLGYWLKKFDEPLRTEVFECIEQENGSGVIDLLKVGCESKSEVISLGFCWDETKKPKYWEEIFLLCFQIMWFPSTEL